MLVMHGAVTDNNATLFYQGYYNEVLQPLVHLGQVDRRGSSRRHVGSAHRARPSSRRRSRRTKNINSALIPNDENAAPIITYLKTHGVKPKTFPTTGQDATLTGLQNILTGYQCGTVYKPIYLEAQAAAALAMYLRAGKTPPSGLVNGSTEDTKANTLGALGPRDADLGHAGEHERHGREGQLRADGADLLRSRRRRTAKRLG